MCSTVTLRTKRSACGSIICVLCFTCVIASFFSLGPVVGKQLVYQFIEDQEECSDGDSDDDSESIDKNVEGLIDDG